MLGKLRVVFEIDQGCQCLIAVCVENVRWRKSSYAKKVGVIWVTFAVLFSVGRMEIFVYNPN
jgi:hypothetical protein